MAKQSSEALDAQNIKNPHLGWMIGFLFIVSFLGLFSVVPLRKVNSKIGCIYFSFSFFWFLISLVSVTKGTLQILTLCGMYNNDSADNGNRLQIDISKWHCNCSPYQQFSYSSRGKASQVRPFTPSSLDFDKLLEIVPRKIRKKYMSI